MFLLYWKNDQIIDIESITNLSSQQEYIIQLQVPLLEACGGSHHRFNITSLYNPPNEDE